MFVARALHTPICASCRLHAHIATKQLARSRKVRFSTSAVQRLPPRRRDVVRSAKKSTAQPNNGGRASAVQPVLTEGLEPEAAARWAREEFGDQAVPDGVLDGEAVRAFERLYGRGIGGLGDEGQEVWREEEECDRDETVVLREGKDGMLEEVGLDHEEEVEGRPSAASHMVQGGEDGQDAQGEVTEARGRRMRKSKAMGQEDRSEDVVYSDEIDEDLARDLRAAQELPTDDEAFEDEDDESIMRTHPLTKANRFGTSPSTVYLPQEAFVDPATLLLSGMPGTHLSDAAHRTFGGVGLPYSTSTPAIGRTMQQKPIALDASQGQMREIEGDVFMSTLMPGMYASALSVLSETRKRLGTAWAENLVHKAAAGELKILDAGGGGAGVLAVRELLRAEWERMHEDAASDTESPLGLAEADGRIGGAPSFPPLGTATVLTGSDALRKRASQLLENTTFVPRLPDYVHTEQAKEKGKFDIIVASHTLWPLREDYMRKIHTTNLWSLLDNDGGVLCLIEKGVARGFEVVAAARELLLETHISSPESRNRSIDIADPNVEWDNSSSEKPQGLVAEKEKGMIVGPCTNHSGCPMYIQRGQIKGRKEICHFEQRYIRPKFLQTILRARDKNFEDVKFSYLAVMRGRDLRDSKTNHITQGKLATDAAFEGQPPTTTTTTAPHSLTLPRTILPPLKRRGHVILDLCTPSGTLERWTVPKSFSRQAYRDARKSQWGDLWALGAKTRVLRTVRSQNKHARKAEKEAEKEEVEGGGGIGLDAYGRIVTGIHARVGEGGKMRGGKKLKGLREKRDKKGKKIEEDE